MGETSTHPLFRFRWVIFFILASAYFFVYFHRLSLSVVADSLIKYFNISAGTLGALGSIYFYCYAVTRRVAFGFRGTAANGYWLSDPGRSGQYDFRFGTQY